MNRNKKTLRRDFWGTLAEIVKFRGFIHASVKRDFQVKYKNTALGAAWNIINPLAIVFVYTVVFSEIMKSKIPQSGGGFGYPIYVCSGIIFWRLFEEIIIRSKMMFLDNANVLKKMVFPKACILISILISGLVNFGIFFIILSGILIIVGKWPGIAYLALFPLVSMLALFALGVGSILGVLNVFYRDIGHFFGILITFWFWLTPIVYPSDILPAGLRELLIWNPLSPILDGVRSVLVMSNWPDWGALVYPLLLTCGALLLGVKMMQACADEIIDEL